MDQTNNIPNNIPQQPIQPVQKESRPMGPVLGILIIVVLLIVAAIYIWGQKLNNDANKAPEVVPATSQSLNKNATTAATINSKDEFSDVEKNLDASLEGVDNMNF